MFGHSKCAREPDKVQKVTPQSVSIAFRVLLQPQSSTDLQNFAALLQNFAETLCNGGTTILFSKIHFTNMPLINV